MESDILEQAADWLDLEKELTGKQKEQFQEWMSNPDNAAAYNKMKSIMDSDELTVAINLNTNSTVSIFRQTINVKKPLAIAASVMFMCGFIYMLSPISEMNKEFQATVKTEKKYTAELATPLAKRKSVFLEDGSLVELNADSILNVSQNANQRLASLKQGQVFFKVSPEKKRPFIIDIDDSTITVLGTSFDVERTSDYTKVSVYEGTVKVTANTEKILTKGHSIKIKSGQLIDFNNNLHTSFPTWRDGWLEINEGLAIDVIDKLQKYLNKEIILDEKLETLRISGRFSLDKPEESLMLIAQANQLSLNNKANQIVVNLPK